jgi:hypothetical protein
VRWQFRGRPRHGCDQAHGLGILQVGINGCNDHAGFNGDEIDADERHSNPGIDDDAFVEHSIQNVNEAGSPCCSLNGHAELLKRLAA